jgi:trehalose 6-phosphate phosphatase
MIPSLIDVLPEVARRIDRSGPILLALDFDGTLTPLRSRPAVVYLADAVRAVLNHLSRFERVTVMIVSGRSIEDLVDRVDLPGLVYAGNHGLEIRGLGLDFVEPTARALASRLQCLTEGLAVRVRSIPGVVLESKGLTTSLHYRTVAPEWRDEVAAAAMEAVTTDPQCFVANSGHCVWEIRPRVAWHKGSALTWVAEQLMNRDDRLVFFAGDDRTDEDAFASHPDAITVKVGCRDPSTAACYWLPDSESILLFLRWLESYLAR